MANIKDLEIISKEGSSGKFVNLFIISEKHYNRPDEGYYTKGTFSFESIYGPFASATIAKKNMEGLKDKRKENGYIESATYENFLKSNSDRIEYEVKKREIPRRNIIKHKGKLFVEYLSESLFRNRKEIFLE